MPRQLWSPLAATIRRDRRRLVRLLRLCIPSCPSPSSGPGTIAPGQSAQYTASVRLADGTIQTGAEAGVRWFPANGKILRVEASGRITALELLGETILTAAVGHPDPRTEVRGNMAITVVPEGTYRMAGQVTEAESPSLGIPGARVEVTPGPFVASTDDAGRYKLYGIPADAHLRVTKEGYLPHERSLRFTDHATEDVPLMLSGPRLTISGPYTLAIDVVSDCHVPLDWKRRSYEAVVTQTGPDVAVELTEPRFRVNEIGRGNRFTGRVVGPAATFTLVHFDEDSVFSPGPMTYPSVAERLPNGTFLVVWGTVVVTESAGGLSGHLNGALSGWGPGFPTTGEFLGACQSTTHRFTLTPR